MARGGKREGAGRPKGAPNKANASLREAAREYTEDALGALVKVLKETDSDAARVSAAREILDRGFGKASQVISGDEDGGPVQLATEIRLVGVRADGSSA